MPFEMAGHVATTFRAGPAFLVGDAAHRTTPVGGTGMNTAIHGAHNLGWKLAWVLRGWAGDSLLDSYELERRPIGEANVRRSLVRGPQPPADGLAWDTGVHYASPVIASGLGTGTGQRAPHVWVRHRGARVSTLDLFDGRLTVLTGPSGHAWRRAAERVGRRRPADRRAGQRARRVRRPGRIGHLDQPLPARRQRSRADPTGRLPRLASVRGHLESAGDAALRRRRHPQPITGAGGAQPRRLEQLGHYSTPTVPQPASMIDCLKLLCGQRRCWVVVDAGPEGSFAVFTSTGQERPGRHKGRVRRLMFPERASPGAESIGHTGGQRHRASVCAGGCG